VHIAYTPEQERLREDLRAYFSGFSTDNEPEHTMTRSGAYCRNIRRMGEDGWLGIGWPEEYGGQGRTMMDQLIFGDGATTAGVGIPLLTINSVAPALMEYGTAEQRAHLLPRILAGQVHFSIGYSEPGAGTDLAGLRTRAVRDGGDWVISGQKMWTSLISVADYVWLAARTDPDLPRHRGLSVFIVPTDVPGFSWTPVPTISGSITSQTFYEDVRVPADALVGEVNGGWKLITGQLNHERVALCSAAGLQRVLAETVDWARDSGVIEREWVRQSLGRVHARVEFLKLINWKIAWGVDHGARLGPADASATKIFGTELTVEACRLLMECLGEDAYLRSGSPGALLLGRLEQMYRQCLMLTFGGGTNEIQRDMIAMLGLGMPRPPR
jgi:alkylation response protein AidB-like acyl-CoA dehydrogenase